MKRAGSYKITRQGQITIPAEARKELDLQEGDLVDVYFSTDLIVIKKKKAPMQVFDELASKATQRFKEGGITRKTIEEEAEKARKGI